MPIIDHNLIARSILANRVVSPDPGFPMMAIRLPALSPCPSCKTRVKKSSSEISRTVSVSYFPSFFLLALAVPGTPEEYTHHPGGI
jgi:hypothetical protein